MDDVNKKAAERLGDILDTIKVELDTIANNCNTYEEDLKVSETILNLSYAFEYIYDMIKEK